MLTASRIVRAPVILVIIALLCSHSFGQNKVARITGNIDDTRIARMKGNISPLTRAAKDLGPVDASFTINRATLHFQRSAQQQAALDKLLAEQQDPVSPNFHQWLTPAQFGDRFGLSPADFAKVSGWLASRGFRIVDTPRSRTYIAFSGTAQQITDVFRTPIHQFFINGEKHFANSAEPAIPAALSGIVQPVGSLHDFRPRPRVTARRVNPNFTSSTSGNHFVAPDDFATIYNLKSLYNNGNDGTGVTIAVMGQTDINISDTTMFRSLSGLAVNNPTKHLLTGTGFSNPGIVTADLFEATLDVQWSGAVAPNASILYVYSNNVIDAFQYSIEQNVAPIISISYGDCEAHWTANEVTSMNSLAQQASAQGQTIVAASGDSGAADCDYQVTVASNGLAVDIPAALPNVTGMGGTTFNEGTTPSTYWNTTNNTSNGSAISYIPEDAWNDTAFELTQSGGTISSTGGGKSTLFAKPSWQTGTGVPAANSRYVPDVSLASSSDHDGYLTCLAPFCVNGYRDGGGFLSIAGGTSVAAPAFAGIVALIDQKTGTRQGNINPTLYSLAASAPNSFHDIVTGDNKVPCLSGTTGCPSGTTTIGFTATPGYDQVTGLGSVNASNLITQWPGAIATPDFAGSAAAPSMTLTRITTSTTGNQNITFTAQNGFTGTINLSCAVAATLPGVTCALNPTSLTNSGTTVLTVTIPAKSAASGATLARLTLPFALGFFFIGGLCISTSKTVPHPYLSRRWRDRAGILTLVLTLALLLTFALAGCGGGGSSSSNPSGGGTGTSTPLNGTLTVTATSGTTTHTVPISVTVN
jgi:subtilase family serine protease